MNKTINKVGPLTGIDFSKLRNGGLIRKFTEGGGATNTSYIAGNNSKWQEQIWTPEVEQKVLSVIYDPNSTDEQVKAAVQKINDIQKNYEDLRKQHGTLGTPVTYDKAVADYQTRINTEFGDVNTIGINNGITSKRYGYAANPNSGDNASTNWKSDGYWGAQTNDRTVLGYDGDWNDETASTRLADINKILEKRGLKISKGLEGDDTHTNAYYINPLQDPNKSEEIISKGKIEEDGGGGSSIYKAKEYEKPFKFNFKPGPWTDGIHLANVYQTDKKGINDYYDLLQQQKTALIQPGHENFRVGSNLIERESNAKAANAAMANTYRNATSNDDYNSALFNQANALRLQTDEQNNNILQKKVNADNDKLSQVESYNTLQQVETSNKNMQNLTAMSNTRLQWQAARKKALAELSSDFQNKLDESHNKWLSNARTERAQAIKDYNKYMQTAYTYGLRDEYMKATETPIDDYADVVADEYLNNAATFSLTPEEQQAVSAIGNNKEALAAYIVNNPDSTLGKMAVADRKADIEAAEKKYLTGSGKAAVYAAQLAAHQPLTFTGEGLYLADKISDNALWDPKSKALSFAKGGRFLEYLEHNRKVYKDMDERVNHQSSINSRLLQTQLNAINQQTLALLRSIFK